tara:strand:+ start:236 stop:1330 length:1095 start_codon:yes stop_codon:yes gene_type:complete
MELSFNTPINRVSFGQVSLALLREAFVNKDEVLSLPISNPDLSSHAASTDKDFFNWVEKGIRDFPTKHSRDRPTFKLWHLEKQNGFSHVSDNQALMTFYELDSPTELEINIAKNSRKLIVTSRFTKEVFESAGVSADYIPLGFDESNFQTLDKQYHTDGRIVFNLCGKFEFRKRHTKILSAWAKKYGNNKKYALQAAVFNPFIDENGNNEAISKALNGERYFNISFLPMMQTNEMYNDFLNSGNIVIGMSGGEGWGLPEFQSVCLGKHAVILDAHGYQSWANSENSVMVSSTSKIDCVDGLFFKKGESNNQGKIFDWTEDDFLSACDMAIERVEADRVNQEGLKLKEEFSYKNTYQKILEVLNR